MQVIGSEIVIPNRFMSQKEYVTQILESQIQKRLTNDKGYADIEKLPGNWESYNVQSIVNCAGSPSESVIEIICAAKGRDLVIADNKLKKAQAKLLEKGLETKVQAPDTVSVEETKQMIQEEEIEHEC